MYHLLHIKVPFTKEKHNLPFYIVIFTIDKSILSKDVMYNFR